MLLIEKIYDKDLDFPYKKNQLINCLKFTDHVRPFQTRSLSSLDFRFIVALNDYL